MCELLPLFQQMLMNNFQLLALKIISLSGKCFFTQIGKASFKLSLKFLCVLW